MRKRFSVLIITLCSLAACHSSENSTLDPTVPTTGSGSNLNSGITGVVSTFVGDVGVVGHTDGTGANATFYGPIEITSDGTHLYLADTLNNIIRVITISTGQVATLVGSSTTSGSDDAIGTSATFNKPYGVASDGTNLFVSDNFNDTIRKIVISSGVVTTFAGSVGSTGSIDGVGVNARFDHPCRLTILNGDLYVADAGNGLIRKIEISSATVSTLAGIAGNQSSQDGIGQSATFFTPNGITNDGNNLYVVGDADGVVRKVVLGSAVVTTLAGTSGIRGSADGIGAGASFNTLRGVTTDGTNVYVTDSGNESIRKIVISTGEVTTFLGTAGTVGFADGSGSAVEFRTPLGLTMSGGVMFVVDSLNEVIREVH